MVHMPPQTANQAAMLHQMPIFMAALHGQPESPPVADSLVMITFDVVAHRLCVRQHRAHLCVLDSFETTKLGEPLPSNTAQHVHQPSTSVQRCSPEPLAEAQSNHSHS